MILLMGVKSDPVLRYFFEQPFVRRDKKILFINIDRVGKDIFVSDRGWLLPSGEVLPHSSIQSVYNRLLSVSDNPWLPYINWLLDDYYPNVINRPKDNLVNFSKLWQLEYAKKLGFLIPRTKVYANDRFLGGKSYIYKSISSIRSIVEPVKNNKQKQVNEPVIFQPDKGRHNVRVHVVKGRYIAQEVVSLEVDYRYDLHACFAKQCKIPLALETKIKELSDKLGLIFSGIDFVVRNGRYYFLEINPSPGYAYFEKQLFGTPISQSLYKVLKTYE